MLSSNGNIISEPRVIKSTNPAFAPYAVKAIKDASPFPGFPKELNKTEETFKISLYYEYYE